LLNGSGGVPAILSRFPPLQQLRPEPAQVETAAFGRIGKPEAQSVLQQLIRDTEVIRAAHPQDLSPTFYLAVFNRLIASITTGQTRRDAFLASAAAWRSWPATSYTIPEEQKDLAETNR
jgi:hypothetical protein